MSKNSVDHINIDDSDNFVALFNTWVAAWESRNEEHYLAFYADDFANQQYNFQQWAQRKRLILRQKTFVDIDVSKLSVFTYPSENKLKMVEFYQQYKSKHYSDAVWKRQFWRLTDNRWQIIDEHSY